MFESKDYILILFVVITSLILFSLCLIVYLVIDKFQKKRIKYQADLLNMNSRHEQEILKAQIQVQEHTFSWISSEIHDNIGQKLSLAKLHLNRLKIPDSKFDQDLLNDAVQIITETLNDLRDISKSASQEKILQEGFLVLLKTDIKRMNRSGSFQFKLTIVGDEYFLEPNVELMIYRTIQESLNNVLKHSKATHVSIMLHYQQELITIEVKDNGVGFSESEIKHGNGLSNIQKRVKQLKGSANVLSQKGKGTTIQINIPIDGKQKI
jgi:signal transduction histidine kinase